MNVGIYLKVYLENESNIEKIKTTINNTLDIFQDKIKKISCFNVTDNLFLNKELTIWFECSFEFFYSIEFFEDFIKSFKLNLTSINLHYTIGIGKLFKKYTSFKITNENVRILSYGWGTCTYPGNFYIHFYNSQNLSKTYLRNNRNFQQFAIKTNEELQPIYGNFYHDLGKIVIYFPIPPSNIDCEVEQKFNTIGRIKVSYKNMKHLSISEIKKSYKNDNNYVVTFNFWLSFPVKIDVYQQMYTTRDNKNFKSWKWKQVRTYDDDLSTIQAIYESTIFYLQMEVSLDVMINLIERLSSLTNMVIEFVDWKKNYLPMKCFIDKPFDDNDLRNKLLKNSCFELGYLIDSLLSKGLFVKIHILTSIEGRQLFIDKILDYYKNNKKITLSTMENLIKTLDEKDFIKDILSIFEWLYNNETMNEKIINLLDDKNKLESNYVYIRKVIITPTRMIFKLPTLMISNRVIRLNNPSGEKLIKIIFKSDDNRSVVEINNNLILRNIANEYLDNGITVGGYQHNFLGTSNSQMRENSCYFFRGSYMDIIDIRYKLGSIKQEAISKMIARVGQCFTQSWEAKNAYVESEKLIQCGDYNTPVWIKSNEKSYCYSDGCSMISLQMAKNIASSFRDKFTQLASCYQFRFRGCKGVLATYPILDKIKQSNIIDKISLHKMSDKVNGDTWMTLCPTDIVFRNSQIKFLTSKKHRLLEIVKSSKPSEVSLNRPLINVMDQVSRMQSAECNRRICNRIHELYDNHVTSIIETLLDEQASFQTLSCMNLKYFGVKQLKDTRMFSFQREIFFKNLINSYSSYQINYLLKKFKIKIPSNLGRTMFGVIDESGCLEYGQVFIQYSIDMNHTKNDYINNINNKIIHIGKVLVTKNPTIVPGDVRIFEAVDIESLHDLVDVIVFPRDGPKPHTTEIAGSDLDGDEYSIIFDKTLFFDYNMEPFDFDKENSEKHVVKGIENHMDFDGKMKQFMIDFLSSNSVGVIASTHLVQSDFFGLDSEVCKRIAIKHNTAIDFQKSGSFPKPLTKIWDDNVPPEAISVVPDFFESDKSDILSYKSNRLLGELYNRFAKLKTLLNSSDLLSQKDVHKKNPLIYIDNWKKYYEMSKEYYNNYSTTILSIMKTYGMENEGELFYDCKNNSGNNFTRSDKDLLLDHNITIIIKQKIEELIYMIKSEILETFYPLDYYYDVSNKIEESEKIRLVLESPMIRYPEGIKQFAVAAYHVTYDSSKDNMLNIFSFPWIFWDVLKDITTINSYFNENNKNLIVKSFNDSLTQHIMEWYSLSNEDDKDLYELFKNDNEMKGCLRYMKCYKNLDILLSFLLSWGKIHKLTKKIKKGMLVTLFIQCLTGYHNDANIKSNKFISPLSDLTDKELEDGFDINSFIGGLGGHCLNIFSILKSYQFKKKNEIHGWDTDVDCGYTLTCEDCINIHDVAEMTINNIAFSHTFDILPQYDDNIMNNCFKILSYPSISISLPSDKKCGEKLFFDLLKKRSQLEMIKYRKSTNNYYGNKSTISYIVTPIGTYQSYIKFKDLIRIDQPTTFTLTKGLDFSHILATKLYIKICGDSFLIS